MPQLGETVTEGTITRWMKSVGEQVERDEPLFEVSTDKVDTEVPSPAAGVLSEILVPEGETVDVGTRLAVIGDGQAAPASADAATPAPASADAATPAPPEAAAVPASTPAPTPVAPVAPEPTQAEVIAPTAGTPPPVPPAFVAGASIAPNGAAQDDALLLSPMVRRLMSDNGINPAQVRGTGLGGRITREDVLGLIDAQRANGQVREAPSPAPDPAPSPVASAPQAASSLPTPSAERAVVLSAGDRIVPFSNVRRRTAEHMVRSKSTSPHAFIAAETDFENVERVRRSHGARFRAEEGFSLTYLPFVARAAVEALREFPNLNASVAEDSLVVHAEINLGIAVDLDYEGLIVPVVHRAEEVTLRGIARRIRDLADRARTRQLSADDIAGGTFSITNDGPFGTYFTVPIINQPQVAILATDGVKRRPVVIATPDGGESIGVHSVGVLGMSWDHRAVDGAYVSAYLRRVGELLSTRDWSAEL
jgi:2-oxoglutarate dehydrogenase E2 component (dihydrolipoamide succinyltransferase)